MTEKDVTFHAMGSDVRLIIDAPLLRKLPSPAHAAERERAFRTAAAPSTAAARRATAAPERRWRRPMRARRWGPATRGRLPGGHARDRSLDAIACCAYGHGTCINRSMPWYSAMAMTKRLVISRGGQVSVPAAVRKRWGTRAVIAEDRGEELVLRPAPDDPIEAVRGIFAAEIRHGQSIDEMRQAARSEQSEQERRR